MKVLPVALILAAAAFGSSTFAATPTKIVGSVKNGRKLFVAHDCGACHMMAAANAMDGSGVGADLDTSRKTYAQMIAQITNGGHGMTGYKRVLTTSQIQDLAAFVFTTSHPK